MWRNIMIYMKFAGNRVSILLSFDTVNRHLIAEILHKIVHVRILFGWFLLIQTA